MSHAYEIEIKSLLISKENADALVANLEKHDKDLKLAGENKQSNRYFNVPAGVDLERALSKLIPENRKADFERVIKEGKKLSIRTRQTIEKGEEKIIFVIKASIGDDSSANGVKRIEFESQVAISIDELDKALLDAGLTYQAKWSRERKEYISGDIHICLDKNAGYGYLAEFEKIISDEKDVEKTKEELLSFMEKMGAKELPQDRLERMFAHYNTHWNEYYGTDKTFIIE